MDQEISTSEYTAVLLAAGYGSRISGMTDRPKCLLEVNGETLIEKNFAIWKNLGIRKVNIVVGYKKELIQTVTKKYENDFELNLIENTDYKTQGNTFSLYIGIKDIRNACLIFDADLAYEEKILKDFLLNTEQSEILVGEGSLDDVECAKTLVDNKGYARMTVDKREVSKEELRKYKFAGEAIGILKFNKKETSNLIISAQNFLEDKSKIHLNWEHLLNDFLLENEVGTHLFKNGKWVEIDTPEDYELAKKLFEG